MTRVVVLEKMEGVGAYGGGKAGGSFDPLTFVQRPQVILRALCWVSNYKLTNFKVNIKNHIY